METAVDRPEWFGKQIGDELDGMMDTRAACEASGLEWG